MGEQFRSLRNQLLFANHSDHSSRFFVTSLAGNEGKSFVASNLAVCAAQAGKKTVLLDFDFENAKCSMRFNLGHEKGISDFLAGAACLKDVTFECPDQQNLSIIPVGTSRINCSEKLIGGALESILTSLAANFDCIIVCGSSILNDTNMISLTHNTDKTIFVVRQGKTTKENLTMLMDEKLIDEIKEPSFVFNGVRGRGLGIRYYGSVFGYGFNTIPRKLKKA
jgi:capsular exopolysaccharide synthesis family protein